MEKTFAQSWLSLQCQMIPHVIGGVAIFSISPGDSVKPTACWPDETSVNPDLLAAASLAMYRQAPVVSAKEVGTDNEGKENIVAACPLLRNGEFYGMVSVQIIAPKGQQAAVVHLLQWGAAWLDLILARDDGSAEASSALVISTLSVALKSDHADAGATAAVNKLTQHLPCERVSIGLLKNRNIRIQALSQSASYEPRSNLIRNIEAAMNEAIEQDTTIVYPHSRADTNYQVDAHALLSMTESQEFICTIPLTNDHIVIGAICFERLAGRPFQQSTVRLCEDIAQLLALVLQMKQQQDRPLLNKIREDMFAAPVKRLMTPRNLRWKLALGALLVFVGVTGFINGVFRITAPASLEGMVQRVVVAPFEGYIAKAHVRAGETVKSGDLLAELDDKDLKLERQKMISKREEMRKQYDKALAGLDHARTRISRTQVAQVEAKLTLIDEQLGRTKLHAPFDGMIITGDLSQSLGTPVKQGQILFEMAPLDEYRVVLQVDERDIENITVAQHGHLTLTAMPGERIPLVVEKVASVYQSDEENTVFRVEARIAESESTYSLRPGMQGIGKIEVGQRSYLSMWTRRLVGWLQLRLWAWLP